MGNEPVTSRSASTSKVESKPPPKPVQQGEKSKVKPKPAKKIEVMEIEEDNLNFETLGNEVIYPVFCQPMMVKLGKQLNKQAKGNNWEILKDSAKVFWKNEIPYAFCHLCPVMANENRYRSEKVKMVDNISPGLLSENTNL